MRGLSVRTVLAVAACSIALVALAAPPPEGQESWADARADAEVSILVAPQTINLDGQADGDWVTVHTDIPYAVVDTGTVALNGLAAAATFADDRGNLVAKFSLAAIRGMVAPPEAELILTGMTEDGASFSGIDTVKVLSR